MQILLYVGQAVARDQVLAFSKQLIPLATRLTLVATGSGSEQPSIADAIERLEIPEALPVTRRVIADNVQDAIITAASEAPYDLVVLGKLHRPLARLLGKRSKTIAQRVQPSVLRVQGRTSLIRRVLVASGGDFHTFDDVRVAAQVAGPLGAEITLMHIVSQQSLVFQGFAQRRLSVDEFLTSTSPEASTLRRAAELLRERDIAVQVRGRVGPVLDELLAELRSGHYDLLVVGAHRIERPLDRILLENITGELLDISPIPVLVVKGHPTDE